MHYRQQSNTATIDFGATTTGLKRWPSNHWATRFALSYFDAMSNILLRPVLSAIEKILKSNNRIFM
jgi:hypothetical protein